MMRARRRGTWRLRGREEHTWPWRRARL